MLGKEIPKTRYRAIREFTENKIPNFKIIPTYYKVL
jgi:hypothetical protein